MTKSPKVGPLLIFSISLPVDNDDGGVCKSAGLQMGVRIAQVRISCTVLTDHSIINKANDHDFLLRHTAKRYHKKFVKKGVNEH
jgi:hypothetical protein